MSAETAYLISGAMIVTMKIVCFILGYLTIRLGYNLISSGAKGQFSFSTKLAGFKADLASVSPGLLFVLLGVMLIGFAMFVDKPVEMIRDPVKERRTTKKPEFLAPGELFDTLSISNPNDTNYENNDKIQ